MHAHDLNKLGLSFHLFTFILFIYLFIHTHTVRTIFNVTMFTHHLWETVGIALKMQFLQSLTRHGRMFPMNWKTELSDVSQNLAFVLNGPLLNWGILKCNALEAAWYVERVRIWSQEAPPLVHREPWVIYASSLSLSDSICKMGIIVTSSVFW